MSEQLAASREEYEKPALEEIGTVQSLTHDDPDKSRGDPEQHDITIIWSDKPGGL